MGVPSSLLVRRLSLPEGLLALFLSPFSAACPTHTCTSYQIRCTSYGEETPMLHHRALNDINFRITLHPTSFTIYNHCICSIEMRPHGIEFCSCFPRSAGGENTFCGHIGGFLEFLSVEELALSTATLLLTPAAAREVALTIDSLLVTLAAVPVDGPSYVAPSWEGGFTQLRLTSPSRISSGFACSFGPTASSCVGCCNATSIRPS